MDSSQADLRERGNMAPEEFEIAMKLCENDPEFKQLWDEHRELKGRVLDFESKSFLTTEEEMEMKKLKRLKLAGKDKIAQKIRDYKVGVAPPG